MTKRTIPYKFLQKWFTDADYQIYFEWDKLVAEYLIDWMRWWSRKVFDVKIKWDKFLWKLVSYEEQERYNDPLETVKFKHYFTVKDWKDVKVKPELLYNDWWEYDISNAFFNRNKKFKSERHELRFLIPGAETYIVYHLLWKEKAKEYCDNQLRKFNRKYRFRQYREKSSKILEKYNTKWIYEDGDFDYDHDWLNEKERESIVRELEDMQDEYVLWDDFDMKLRIEEREEMRDIAEKWYPDYYKVYPRYKMTLEEEVREYINRNRKEIKEGRKKLKKKSN